MTYAAAGGEKLRLALAGHGRAGRPVSLDKSESLRLDLQPTVISSFSTISVAYRVPVRVATMITQAYWQAALSARDRPVAGVRAQT